MVTVLTQITAEALGCPVELVQRDGGRHVARARQRSHGGQPHHGHERQRDPRRGREDPRGHGAGDRGQRPALARRGRPVRAEAGRPGRPRLVGAAGHHVRPGDGPGRGLHLLLASPRTWSRSRWTRRPARRASCKVWSGHDAGRVDQPHHRRGPGRGRRRAGPRLRAGRGARACATAASSTTSSRPTSSPPRWTRPRSRPSWSSTSSPGGRTAPRAWARRRSSRWRPR